MKGGVFEGAKWLGYEDVCLKWNEQSFEEI